MKTFCVIIPAHNEAGLIGQCLGSLLASDRVPEGWQIAVLVVANGCKDDTAAIAGKYAAQATARGWSLTVFDEARGGKLNALNIADKAARGTNRAYLDADVTIDPSLLGQLVKTLDSDTPRYASGHPALSPAQSRITHSYGRFWAALPFATSGVPGFGIFAMNAAGRARWGQWPDIISDDTFARLSFKADERIRVDSVYHWPMVEGFTNLVRVRRRQDDGVKEIAARFPHLLDNDDKPRLTLPGLLSRMVRDPLGFAAYAGVSLAVKTALFQTDKPWVRGR
ncbi:MAG: glycosyltransferase [Rhodobacteraceae bacterium]|nr:glycosyltransferase [Paracoccaceae bacterium]